MDCPLGDTYTVKEGDTLQSIARGLGISQRELIRRNPLVDPAQIQPGQVLCVPGALQAAPQLRPAPDPPPNPQPQIRPSPPQPPQPPRPPQPPQPPHPPRPPQPPQPPQPPRPPQPPQPPRPPQPPTPPCPPGYRQATVQPGDSIEDLLIRYDVSYRALRAANPSLTDPPRPGQRVCVPPAGSRGCQSYQLARGDTLERAAARLRTTPGVLLRLNPTMAPRDFTQGRIICID